LSTAGRTMEILLVEDNPGDIRLTQEAFREGNLETNLSVVQDGVEAMAFLRQEGKYTQVPRPDVIILDLNLPKKDGREVLAELKQDPHLKRIPVVVFTSSKAEQDILRAYDLYANCYITKPVDLEEYIELVSDVEAFWLRVVKLPSS
jgi:chemotaxis family two-component system response regulator Rcp1